MHKSDPLRTLARSSYYQNLYLRAKELNGIYLFENTNQFSKIQLEFLYWISAYNRLYQELAMENKHLTENMIKDDRLCDCFLIWETKKRDKPKEPSTNKSTKKRQTTVGNSSLRFV